MKQFLLKFIPVFFLFFIVSLVFFKLNSNAAAYRDFQTTPVGQEDGDTIITHQVACSSTTATLLTTTQTVSGTPSASQNFTAYPGYRALRKRTFHNKGSFTVYIGTQATGTTLSSIGYDLTPSSGTRPFYETHNTAPFYCLQDPLATGSASITVTVIEEYNSIP